MWMKNLIDKMTSKIEAIGGVQEKDPQTHQSLSSIESQIGGSLPLSYVLFMQKYGACSFNEFIKVSSIDSIPIADNDQMAIVNFFYSWNNESTDPMQEILAIYKGKFLINMFLFVMAVPVTWSVYH